MPPLFEKQQPFISGKTCWSFSYRLDLAIFTQYVTKRFSLKKFTSNPRIISLLNLLRLSSRRGETSPATTRSSSLTERRQAAAFAVPHRRSARIWPSRWCCGPARAPIRPLRVHVLEAVRFQGAVPDGVRGGHSEECHRQGAAHDAAQKLGALLQRPSSPRGTRSSARRRRSSGRRSGASP